MIFNRNSFRVRYHLSTFFYFVFFGTLSISFYSCNYQIEDSNPSLPDGKKTLAILSIQNKTPQGGLEIIQSQELKKILRNNSSIRLTSVQDAELILDIQLNSLEPRESSISSSGTTVTQQLKLIGTVTLRDNQSKDSIWREKLEVTGNLLLEEGETSDNLSNTTINRGIEEVTIAFAKRVFERLFHNF